MTGSSRARTVRSPTQHRQGATIQQHRHCTPRRAGAPFDTRGGGNAGTVLARQGRHSLRHGPRPQDRKSRRRRDQGHAAAPSAAPICICMGGFVPEMKSGDVLGHETMGEVVEAGSAVRNSRSAIAWSFPSPSAAANAGMCKMGLFSLLRALQSRRRQAGRSRSAIPPPACSAIRTCMAAFPAARREYLRVPYADVGPIKVPGWPDRRAGAVPVGHFPHRLHGGGKLPTSSRGDTVLVFGCGPVGQFAIRSAFLLGAGRVIAVDTVPERLALARAGRRRDARLQRRRSAGADRRHDRAARARTGHRGGRAGKPRPRRRHGNRCKPI